MPSTDELLRAAQAHAIAGRFEQSAAMLASILASRPENAEARRQMAILDFRAGREAVAMSHIEFAARAAPESAQVRLFHALLLLRRGDAQRARPMFASVGINLDSAHGLSSVAQIALDLGDVTFAESLLNDALALDPANLPARLGVSGIQHLAGRAHEGVATLRAGLGVCADEDTVRAALCHALPFSQQATAADMRTELAALGARIASSAPPPPPFLNTRDPDRPLRIGYLAQDLGVESAIARFLTPALLTHDRERFHVTGYCVQATMPQMSPRLRAAADRWIDCSRLPDDQLADRIRADSTDILVDLAGHTYACRPGVMARRPAPIQVTFIGDAKTTGLPGIDFKFVDAITDPPGSESAYTEKLIRLDHSFLCFDPHPDSPETRLPSGRAITFASFNATHKTGPATIDLWARILSAVPDASLLLKFRCLSLEHTARVFRDAFTSRGINAARIRLLGHIPSAREHLSHYHSVDIALDPFPYNGTTTTCDALWMGVPVITLRGTLHAGRVGASLLTAVGLPDLIAETPDQYVEIAKSLAADAPRRAHLRQTLRPQMAASPLGNAAAYARKLDATYRRLWQEWCASPQA